MLPRIFLVLLTLGCGPQKNDETSTDPNDDPTGAGSTDESTGAGSTDDPTGAASTGDPTTGGMCEGLDRCSTFCDRLATCGLDEKFAACPCDSGDFTGTHCFSAWDDVVACFRQTDCGALQADDAPCWALLDQAVKQCQEDEMNCARSYSESFPDPVPGECTFGLICTDGSTVELDCTSESCTCLLDGVPAGTCPNAGGCVTGDVELQSSLLDACCC